MPWSPGDDAAKPAQIADLMLGIAFQTEEPLYLEPDHDAYQLRVERRGVVSNNMIESRVAHAAIARLAFIAELDLATSRTLSGTVVVQREGQAREIMVTVRRGQQLRADVVAVPDPRAGRRGDPREGDEVGNYKIVRQLGEGGMGTVYQVEHVSLGRSYAMKILRAKVVERDRAAAQQFLREARLAARIHHPHIVDVFDFGYIGDGRPYLVMELLDGESLASLIHRGPVEPLEVVGIARQLASALAAAHDVGVIHADVTPANALIAAGGLKLVDFGLARLRSDFTDEASDMVLGTPAYISPEQLRGLPATEHSDQYGLGAVLYHLLVGDQPYYSPDLRTLCKMHLEAPIPPVKSPLGQLPGRLDEIVIRCLQKTASARYPDMHGVIAALAEVDKVSKRRDWTRWLGR